MNYGFVIDNRKCIGCHACSTACKSENEVPLGVHRTWVKYVETGVYPNATRHFQVTRCNHCANPPCVRICPVTAMYQRTDGIVEFDSSACIGCKACLQACPYDAIYIDPETHTAAKCHYCAHRTEIGLEPACVVVCPEHAIIAGDMDDPASEISRLLAAEQVTVRKPEQGTAPKLFYIHGSDPALRPTAGERTPESFLWADVIPLHPKPTGAHPLDLARAMPESAPAAKPRAAATAAPPHAPSGAAIRAPGVQGDPWPGPIMLGGGRMAEQMVQVSFNAQHTIPWRWPVPAYLVTKAIGSGLFLVAALVWGLGWPSLFTPMAAWTALFALAFTGATAALLVADLERPERFFYILTRPQWSSWLARGAFLLLGYSVVAAFWWLVESAVALGWLSAFIAAAARPWLLALGAPLAVGAAIYTAYLFGQAEGRDLWQSALLPFHLFVQALAAGAAFFLVLCLFFPEGAMLLPAARVVLACLLFIDLFLLAGEFGMPHASETAARAAHTIRRGRYARLFWGGALGLGHLLPLLLLLASWPPAAALAGLCFLAGLYVYEYIYVLAPQEIPNS